MKNAIGFSTGSISPGNARQALSMLSRQAINAIELSALRTTELEEVLDATATTDLTTYRYISFHAPSKFNGSTEAEMLHKLAPIIANRWPIILHPDAIIDWNAWARLGRIVCIENMDNRKPMGRTVEELEPLFKRLPDARFCFDIGHARQIDSTMSLARDLVAAFGDRLVEVHLSIVDDDFAHQPLTAESMLHFGPLLKGLSSQTAIILETPADPLTMAQQLQLATS